MKIGILGGAFDPPHLGHLIIAEQIISYMNLDQMWFVPVYSHPFEKKMSSTNDRLAMTQLVETNHIKASDFEYEFNKSSITIETMRLLGKQYPINDFYWCMGSDLLPDFYKWDEWEKLIREYNIVVYPRASTIHELEEHVLKGFQLSSIPKNITLIDKEDTVITNISSTIVRKRLQEKRSVKYIVPEKVIEYIKKNNLYNLSSLV